MPVALLDSLLLVRETAVNKILSNEGGDPGPEQGEEQTVHEAIREMLQSTGTHLGRTNSLSAQARCPELCLPLGRLGGALTLG